MTQFIGFDIKRAGYAEQFVANLKGTSEQMLNETLEGIRGDISAHAPKGKGSVRAGDIRLAESFYTIPAQEIAPSVIEGYIASRVPAKARAHEYGSGIQGPQMRPYYIRPKNARFLAFEKEGKTLVLPFVIHPGVYPQFYINETLRVWRPALAQRFADAIRLAAQVPRTVHPIGPWPTR